MNKLIILGVLSCVSLFSAPDWIFDGQEINMSEPQLGKKVFALPNSSWVVSFEDLRVTDPSYDADFNDYVVFIHFNPIGVLGQSSHIGGLSSHEHFHHQAMFGPELWVGLYNINTQETWFSGPGYRNDDGAIHAWVSCLNCGTPPDGGTHTPEPSTMLLGSVGLGVVWIIKKYLVM